MCNVNEKLSVEDTLNPLVEAMVNSGCCAGDESLALYRAIERAMKRARPLAFFELGRSNTPKRVAASERLVGALERIGRANEELWSALEDVEDAV